MRSMLFFPALLLSGCALTPNSTPLQQDANWTVGQLPNGMKYHIYPTDDQEISLRLTVNIGSFQESEQQKGYAHLVEHMAFNGSQHFAGNDVIKLFAQAGGSFGADINAFTTYQQTTYKLELNDASHLQQALVWMRDVSDGIEFDPQEVEKEKGVILGEWRRARPEDKPFALNAYYASIDDTVYEKHDPIGDRESIENATAESLKSFYQTWYQPQYSELIITGNVGVEEITTLIEEKFANWQITANNVVEKRRDIPVKTEPRVLFSSVMESPSVHFAIDRGFVGMSTSAQQQQMWHDDVSAKLIQQRLYSVLNDAAEPYQYVYANAFVNNYSRMLAGGVSYAPGQRHEMHRLFVETLASLRDYGVSQAELDSVMSAYQTELTNLDSDWQQRKPFHIADNRVIDLDQGSVSQSKQSYQAHLTQFIALNTLAIANEQLQGLLKEEPVFIMGLGKGEHMATWAKTPKQIAAAYQRPGVKPLTLAVKNEGFLQPVIDGQIVDIRDHDGGFKVYSLSNGVEVWFQQDAQAGKRAYLNFASLGGKAAIDPSLYPAYDITTLAAIRSGLGAFSGTELDSYLRKHDLMINPILGTTYHGVEMIGAKEKLAITLNALYNLATEINVEPRQLDAVKKEFEQDSTAFLRAGIGQLVLQANRSVYLPSTRHRLVTGEQMERVTAEQVQAIHHELFGKNHGFKMVLIADLTPEQVAPLLRQYVASIELQPGNALSYNVAYQPNLPDSTVVKEGSQESSLHWVRVVNQNVAAKVGKDMFIEDMLQRIASARILDQVREKASLDYNPAVYPVMQDQETVSDWVFESQIAPKDAKLMGQQVEQVMAELAENITQEEVNTAAKQLSADLRALDSDPRFRNGFYIRYLINRYGIDALVSYEKTAQSVTLEEVQQRAQSTFGEGVKRMTFVLEPKE
ncbi:insulinase family protein [Vibrio sp. 05-20-BW147]|uniref:M16 family metallopeptidase n=1 Tax=Vibrio sp. 05-20-BW147 TaxID=2575834 RepID=UPI001593B84B|nr:M16 family metallopeptidase [Vibrio sp. 05-20-BW147]NVC64329.1 insulinase family protein [Vibrio sp. 05-20-BW147]